MTIRSTTAWRAQRRKSKRPSGTSARPHRTCRNSFRASSPAKSPAIFEETIENVRESSERLKVMVSALQPGLRAAKVSPATCAPLLQHPRGHVGPCRKHGSAETQFLLPRIFQRSRFLRSGQPFTRRVPVQRIRQECSTGTRVGSASRSVYRQSGRRRRTLGPGKKEARCGDGRLPPIHER